MAMSGVRTFSICISSAYVFFLNIWSISVFECACNSWSKKEKVWRCSAARTNMCAHQIWLSPYLHGAVHLPGAVSAFGAVLSLHSFQTTFTHGLRKNQAQNGKRFALRGVELRDISSCQKTQRVRRETGQFNYFVLETEIITLYLISTQRCVMHLQRLPILLYFHVLTYSSKRPHVDCSMAHGVNTSIR